MRLFSYWRSTTAYRARAALNLKGVAYETVPVDLLAGEQHQADYLELNPNASVPSLTLDDGTSITQSMVIMEYADSMWPEPQLIPKDPLKRAQVLAVANTVSTDIHPINNSRVIKQLQSTFNANDEDCRQWMLHWMARGFSAIEAMLPKTDAFAFGSQPDLADICIACQAYNAHRWGLDLEPYPSIARVERNCLSIPEFKAAHPDQQPEARTVA